mgnify:CR=1 FL=1
MKFIRKEVSRTLLTHWRYNLLLFFVLSSCILMAYIVLYNTRILSEQSREFDSEISGKRYFQISLTSSGYETIFNSEKMYSQIGVIEQRIHESPLWDDFFFFLSSFGLAYSEDGEKILPEIFEDGYELGELNDLNSNFAKDDYFKIKTFAFTRRKETILRLFWERHIGIIIISATSSKAKCTRKIRSLK